MNKTLTKIAVTGASTVLGATAALGLSIPAQAALIGPAQDFNVFVFEDLDVNSDAHGRVAVGGDATLNNFGTATQLPAEGAGDTLVVGGDLNYNGGQVFVGEVVVGGQANLTNVGPENLTVRQGNPIDFDAAERFYQNYSAQLGNLAANGSVTIQQWGAIELKGNSSGLNIFELNASDLASATSFNIEFDSNSTVLVNVTGNPFDLQNSFQMNLNGNPNGVGANQVLFNFADATQLNSRNFSWQGSVLAPFADYNEFSNGHINGQLIAKSVTGTSGEFHIVAPNNGNSSVLFEGDDLPDPEAVPEPLTILGSGMALGFGAFFKRQQSKKQKNAN
ncbi:PEP-CTERM sorting domain-containing protein [Coleofasciculus sp. E2-BRE-01]|uniref:PEP-CTERM sorting domain-containing protein n=1 Tax=Coleofasciculus sp. E2-BRE-01 TaxID=3069524 RepID=UPI0032F8228B